MRSNCVYQFDDFQLEAKERRLSRNQAVIPLTPKAFETLLLLVQHSGKVLEKEFLLNKIWGDTFVEEATLAQNIFTIRRALGTGQNGQQFIETVPRCGYRFTAPVKEIVFDEESDGTEREQSYPVAGHPTSSLDSPEEEDRLLAKAESNFLPINWISVFGRKRVLFGTLFLSGILLSAVTILLANRLNQPRGLAFSKFEKIQFRRMTTGGHVQRLAVSSDGKYLAYVEARGETQALMLRQLASENVIEIVPPKKQHYLGITFSSDANIYYVTYRREGRPTPVITGTLYKVSLLGGAITEVLYDIDSPVAIAPLTGRLAFIRNYLDAKESALIIANPEGKEERKLAVRNLLEPFATEKSIPTWSPDEKLIACPVIGMAPYGQEMQLLTFETANGSQRNLTSQRWTWIGQTAWLKDGSGVLFPAIGEQSQTLTDGIWVVSYPTGGVRQITSEINGFYGLSLTGDSSAIAAVKSELLTTFWAGSMEAPDKARKILQNFSELSLFPLGMSNSPDGKILFASNKNGNIDIWSVNSDGSNQKQITSNVSADFEPVFSVGGNYIVYISNQDGRHNLWRMNHDGTNPLRLTDSDSISYPSVTADGRWIYYAEAAPDNNKQQFVWKIPATGGRPLRITAVNTLQPKISPDGKFIGCYYPSVSEADRNLKVVKLTILSAEDGTVVKQFDETPRQSVSSLAWTPDSRSLIFLRVNDDVSNLWLQPITGGIPRQLTNSKDNIFRFVVSSDGEELIYERGSVINDVILINEP